MLYGNLYSRNAENMEYFLYFRLLTANSHFNMPAIFHILKANRWSMVFSGTCSIPIYSKEEWLLNFYDDAMDFQNCNWSKHLIFFTLIDGGRCNMCFTLFDAMKNDYFVGILYYIQMEMNHKFMSLGISCNISCMIVSYCWTIFYNVNLNWQPQKEETTYNKSARSQKIIFFAEKTTHKAQRKE